MTTQPTSLYASGLADDATQDLSAEDALRFRSTGSTPRRWDERHEAQRWHQRHVPAGTPLAPALMALVSADDLVTELEGLRLRLASQPVIEQSKGILMRHYGIGPDAAFDVLRRWSSHTNRKLRDISEMIVATTTAEHLADAGRSSPELIQLINSLNTGPLSPHNETPARSRTRTGRLHPRPGAG